MPNINTKVNNHRIAKGIAYKGYNSEYFDITYTRNRKLGDYDYWAKIVKIPLNSENLNLGVRLFINSINSSEFNLCFNAIYPKQKVSGVYECPNCAVKQNIVGGWQEYSKENLFEAAREVALPRNWSIDEVIVDKIIIDTRGVSNKFFIDEIQLFLIKK